MTSPHNPVQLTAISNYKLAQLTFAPPDLHSLRKTAIVKNVLETLYQNTPSAWLHPMTRWTFFTPESLQDMTQEGLEAMFEVYVQIMDRYQPLMSLDSDNETDDAMDDDFDETDTRRLYESSIFSHPGASLSNESLARPPQLVNSDEKPTLADYAVNNNYLINNPHPINMTPHPMHTNSPGEDITPRIRSVSPVRNRLSWTSDTGVTSSAVAQHLANEIMNLFDMEFSVDIPGASSPPSSFPSTSSASSPPPSPSSQSMGAKSLELLESVEGSVDSLPTHMPTTDRTLHIGPEVERVTLQDTPFPVSSRRRSSSVPLPNASSEPSLQRVPPQRSSSLKYRQPSIPTQTSSHPPTKAPTKAPSTPFSKTPKTSKAPESSHSTSPLENDKLFTLSKKPSIRKLATLVGYEEKSSSSYTPTTTTTATTTLTVPTTNSNLNEDTAALLSLSRSSLASTLSVSTSSSSLSETTLPVKAVAIERNNPRTAHPPLPLDGTTGRAKRRSYQLVRPEVVDIQHVRRVHTLGHRYTPKKKRASLMEKTPVKRKSVLLDSQLQLQQQDDHEHALPTVELSRSKSAFIRIGRGLRTSKGSLRRRKDKKNEATPCTCATPPVSNEPHSQCKLMRLQRV
ncbi:hypothetical protein BDF14DRAFT_1739882 [Spinellus fusiger]|nr:hypothetical protein BDF14DRAFT_1739882 [Spinellus fusiger]